MISKPQRRVRRSKRAIEFVGNLISKLFGNPGPEEWRQNKRNLLAMKAAIERQLSNSILLHRDIDENRHAINHQNEILKQISKEVLSNSNKLERVDNALVEFELYLELEMMFNSIMEILDMLESIKNDAKSGRCNENGVNQEFLIEHLRDIESNKAGIAPIFASWEWHKYYDLFKNKLQDIFLILTKSDYESCAKIDIFKVCNIRDSKFKSAVPHVVPLMIGHGRAIIVANSSELNITAKSVCSSVTETIFLHTETVVKIPDLCMVTGKTFEIGKMSEIASVSDSVAIKEVNKVMTRKIEHSQMVKEFEVMVNLPKLSEDFNKQNNETITELSKINFTQGNNANCNF